METLIMERRMMKRRFFPKPPARVLLAHLLCFLIPGLIGAQPAPSTDIWAFRLSGGGLSVDLNSVVRVTGRAGYDNQPHFAPGERLLLYTAIDSTGQADIWSFDLVSGEGKNITRSDPESEYSATIMPSLGRFSAIRVEADSTQRLWSFESGGTNPAVLLPEVEPVGYHAWIDDDRLALFVLGSPATLQIATRSRGTTETVAENIGRSLHRIPGKEAYSFVQLEADGPPWITEFDPETMESTPIAPLLNENEFYAWTPGGMLIMGQGSRLFRWDPDRSEQWEPLIDLGPAGILGISRIAVSPGGGWIAIVGQEEG
jgi:hypothetical protein